MNDFSEKIKVLLIDDDEEDYILTKYLFDDFKDRRYTLDWTDDGAKALDAMKSGLYDIYFVDYRLGEYNGLEILREAIADGCLAPIILMTGQGDAEVDNQAMEAGAADYLVKGEIDAPLLERIIRYSLQQAFSIEKMHSSELKFRSVIQSASDAIFLVDENGIVILWNKAAERIFGYTEEEIVGQPSTVLMGAKYAAKAEQAPLSKTITQVLAPMSGKMIEVAGRRKDGSEFPLELSGSIWSSNEGVFYTTIIRDITERKKIRESLKESEERYRELFENANDIIYVHDLQGKFISINQTGEKLFGYTHAEALQLNIGQIVAPEDLQAAQENIAAKLAGKPSTSYELCCIHKSGKRVSFEVNSRIIYEGQKPVAVQGIARDITDRKLAEEERDRLYNVSNDLLATIGFDGKLLHINPAWEKILGYKKDELIGKLLSGITHPDDIVVSKNEGKKLNKGSNISFESRLICKDKSECWISWNSTPIVTEKIYYAVGRNITERKETEQILQRNALFDSLTNLPNRAQFMNHLETAIEKFGEDSRLNFAVLFLDLDRFKIINDSLGHLIGDKLLIAIAERIKASLRPGDVVARLGGDEFTILIHNVQATSDATTVAERIQARLSRPFRLDNYEVFSSASIGIIISDKTNRTPEEFLRDADSAMYRAKESGKARYEIFDDEMHVRNMNLLQVETDLRKAIERREFLIYYQPIVNNQTGEISELEALIRWQHPKYGLVAPNEFINVAEETGLIIPIGEWVLEEACRQTKLWQTTIPALKDLSISVNLSAKQLMHPSLTAQVKDILIKTGLEMKYLKLEVTESTVMENGDIALQVLNDLNAIGINFSTDDFGTGYSSLSYLHKFPFKRIKVDRSFTGKMDKDSKSEDIVQTILMLGNNLNLEVVAEGIETESQLKKLQRMGLPLGQGYLFAKPMNTVFTEKLLKDGLPKSLFSNNEEFKMTKKEGETIIELENYQ